MRPARAAAIVWALGLAGCEPAPPAPPDPSPAWFAEEAAARGLDFVYVSGHDGTRHLMPEIMGGGAALFDMDGDGDLDAYLVQGGRLGETGPAGPGNRLFRNDGTGGFTDVSEGSGADDLHYGMGVTTGDFDNDGDVDLFVTNVGPDTLLANDGEGHFTDVTAAAGVGDDGWTTSAAFLDYDRDGDLDLFACSYLQWSPQLELACFNTMGGPDYCSPRNYMAPAQDRLYRNEGGGVFTDVTGQTGLASFSGTGLGVVAADFSGDGWVDLFVANDGMRDQLWLNRRGTGFLEISHEAGCAFDQDGRAAAGMGVAAADIDGDADIDLLVGNLRNESDCLFVNDGGRFFSNRTAAAGLGAVSRRFTRFGLGFFDFDHDGRLDLFQACGRVMRQADHHGDDPYAEPNLLFRGQSGGRFVEVRPRGGTGEPVVGASRAAAFGDVDGDGAVDVVIVERDAPVRLLRNLRGGGGQWITVRVVDEHGRDALGARVELTVGKRTVVREVRAASSYLAASDPRVHVGLGGAAAVDGFTVRWPDGAVERFGGVPAGGTVVLRRGEGEPDRVS